MDEGIPLGFQTRDDVRSEVGAFGGLGQRFEPGEIRCASSLRKFPAESRRAAPSAALSWRFEARRAEVRNRKPEARG